jgi:hypothetical protein
MLVDVMRVEIEDPIPPGKTTDGTRTPVVHPITRINASARM